MIKKLRYLFTLMLLLVASVSWAQDVTVTFSELGLENGVQYKTLTADEGNVTFAFGNGGNDGKYYNTGAAIRVYGGGHMTVSSTTKVFKEIVLTFGSGDGSNTITTDNGTYSNNKWTGSANSVTFTVGGSSGHRRIASVAVTYQSDGSAILANNVNINYDATSGAIVYSINNPTTGTNLTAETEASWLTLGTVTAESVPFTCEVNTVEEARTATVTLTYGSVTADVTVTQAGKPATITTIPDLFAAATSTSTPVNVTFGNWVVSGVNGSQLFVTDGTNGFIVYQSGHGFEVGDILSGTASCNLVLYSGSAEITGLTSETEGLTVTKGGTVTPANIALADLTGVNTGALVSYENLTCNIHTSGAYTNYDLTDGTTTITAYKSLYDFTATPDLEEGKKYNVTGVFVLNNTNKRILPRSSADIIEVVEPFIVLSPSTISATCEETAGTIAVTYNNFENVNAEVKWFDASGNATTCDWISTELDENNNVIYQIAANTSTSSRTAYMKVYANGVYSDLVTFTQAEYVKMSNYTLATSITSGKHYVIASGAEGSVKVMGEQRSNNRGAFDATITDGKLSVSDEYEFVIESATIGDATGYSIFDEGEDGYLYAASSSSNNLKTQAENNANGIWTITIDADGKASVVAEKSSNRNVMQYNSGSTIFSCYASASQSPVYLFEKVEDTPQPEAVTVTFSELATDGEGNYYATLYYGDRNLVVPSDVEASTVTVTNGQIKFSSVGTIIPKGTGVVLKTRDASKPYTFAVTAETGTDVKENMLLGTDEQTTIEGDGKYYMLSRGVDENGQPKANSIGFYWDKGSNEGTKLVNKANRAYLVVPDGEAKGYPFGGDATGIEGLNVNDNVNANEVYDLQGRRMNVNNMPKGIYIVNGKKVVIK